ncbi:MAG: hypothetical protein AB1941_26760 [Gemmatimonadota bacterium]
MRVAVGTAGGIALAIGMAGPLGAQRPASVGTAAGLGGAAVVESRRADALLWNPALLPLWDGGASGSHSYGQVEVSQLPRRRWLEAAGPLGLAGDPSAAKRAEGIPGGVGNGSSASVVWAASQSRGFAVSLSSHAHAAAEVPEEVAVAVAGRELPAEAGSAAEGGFGERAAQTVLAVGYGVAGVPVPGLRGLWVGATVKGAWTHEFARGAFAAGAPGGEVYREARVAGVPGLGLDVGGLVGGGGPVRAGIAVSNAAAWVFRPRRGPRLRVVSVGGAGGAGDVQSVRGPELDETEPGSADRRLADGVWEDAKPAAVLRGGAAVEMPAGTVALGYRRVLRDGGLEPDAMDDPFTVAYATPGAGVLRVFTSWGGGARTWGGAIGLGGCARRVVLGAERRGGAADAGRVGVSASVVFGGAGCGRGP